MSPIKALPEELQKVAIEELCEVPERIPTDLQDLKAWIQQQPHLKARLDDQFLVQFLRGCKYSLKRAKEKIDRFYSLRAKHPEMCSVNDVDEPTLRKFHNTRTCVFLPTPLNDSGPRIVYVQADFPPQDYTTTLIFQYAISVFEVLLMQDPYACINGIVAVLDYAQATPKFFRLITPTFIMNFATFFGKTFPIRIKAIYCVNVNSKVQKFLTLVYPFVPEKLRNRIVICGNNLDELGEKFPKKYFPRDFGGENGSLADLCADYNKVWDEYREYFKANAEYGTDESLRLDNPDDEFGYGGSFRQMKVD